ncbi:hypothetical protein HY523_02030 [Candidatus Berkelbacteria bacterium]|nr:hypothetical protein [Candidatus Berkelbacteria bacterium]
MLVRTFAKNIVITLVAVLLLAQPVLASENNPGPDFLTWFFGGRVEFKKLGITCQLEFGIPKKYSNRQETYIYQAGMGLPPGSRVRLYSLVDTGRKTLSAPVEVVLNKDSGSGWEEAKKYDTTWLNILLDTENRRPGPLVIRVYGEGGRDRDNYEHVWLWILREDQVVTTTNTVFDPTNLSPTTTPTSSPTTTTGNVKIIVPYGAVVSYVSIWVNGQKFVGDRVQGIRYYQGVPAGRVSIRINSPGETWNLPHGVPLEQELRPGQTVEYPLQKGGR